MAAIPNPGHSLQSRRHIWVYTNLIRGPVILSDLPWIPNSFFPSIGVVSHWFKGNLAYATGCLVAGASIGGICFPVMLDRLIPRIGFGKSQTCSQAVSHEYTETVQDGQFVSSPSSCSAVTSLRLSQSRHVGSRRNSLLFANSWGLRPSATPATRSYASERGFRSSPYSTHSSTSGSTPLWPTDHLTSPVISWPYCARLPFLVAFYQAWWRAILEGYFAYYIHCLGPCSDLFLQIQCHMHEHVDLGYFDPWVVVHFFRPT